MAWQLGARMHRPLAFRRVGLDPDEHVRIDPGYLRPSEVDALQADPRKARAKLGWKAKTTFANLVVRMVEHDLELAAHEKRAKG